mgnify:CR=1 FL=1|tara:strand:+ start:1763 stop:1954 length:192 start_codon:yes stop_codon:yes gene_type:complete
MNLQELFEAKNNIDLDHDEIINSINKSGLSIDEKRTMIKKANDIYWQSCLNLKSIVKSEANTN